MQIKQKIIVNFKSVKLHILCEIQYLLIFIEYINYYVILTNIILFMSQIKVLYSKNTKKIIFYLSSIECFFQ